MTFCLFYMLHTSLTLVKLSSKIKYHKDLPKRRMRKEELL